jgi:hypothetical protein
MEQCEQLEVVPPPHCPADGITEIGQERGKDELRNGDTKPSNITVHKNCHEPMSVPLPCEVTTSPSSLVTCQCSQVFYLRCC